MTPPDSLAVSVVRRERIDPARVELTWHTSVDPHRFDRVARILKKIVDHARSTKEGRKP